MQITSSYAFNFAFNQGGTNYGFTMIAPSEEEAKRRLCADLTAILEELSESLYVDNPFHEKD